MNSIYEKDARALELYLDSIARAVEFVELSNEMRPHIGAAINWSGPSHIIDFIRKFMACRDLELDIVYRSLYVNVHAALESYINDLVGRVVEYINARGPSFDDLDVWLINEHIKRTGNVLATVHEPVDYRKYDYFALSKALADCSPGSEPVSLNASAFVLHQGVITPDNISSLFKRVQIEVKWLDVSRDKDLQQALKTAGVKQTENELRDTLSDMVKKRNRIAHTAGVAADISLEVLKSQLAFVKAFVQAFTEHIDTAAKSHPALVKKKS